MKSKRFWRWFGMLVVILLVMVRLSDHEALQAFVLIGGFIEGLRPEPVLTVTEWSERHRILSTKGSAEAGPYRVGRTPYLRKVMDSMSARSTYQLVVFIKGSQIGASEAGFNIVAYYMDMVPCPIFYLMPTVETMERKTKQTIDPMISDCPRLAVKVGKKRSKDGGNTLGQKDFDGGTLFLGGANSAASLASVPVRIVCADEVDRYPGDVDGEGSPVALIRRRMNTFGPRKKLYMPSTPVDEDTSVVQKEFLQTDQHYYQVPCPHCMGLQVLVFEQLRWKDSKLPAERDVHYECIHCEQKIYNYHKTFMLEEDKSQYIAGHPDEGRARWVASHPELSRPDVIGFNLSGLYSPEGWYSWEEAVDDWIKAENNEPEKKAYINTILGKTYKTKGIAPPWQRLYEKAQDAGNEKNVVWPSVAFITAGADVQADRIEVQIRGWMKGRTSQMIDYRVLPGDTSKPEVWADMDGLMSERWCFEDANNPRVDIGIKLLAIDANFNSDHVHKFARKWGTKRVVPIQGRETLMMPFSNPKAVSKTKQGKGLPKGKVWGVGSSYLKELIYGWFRLEIGVEDGVIPAGYCHFLPMDEQFFRGLTAEERVPVRNKRTNAIKYEWVKRYERNEPLDTMVYLTAAAYMLGFDRWTDAKWEREMRPVGKNVVNAVVSVVPERIDDSRTVDNRNEHENSEKDGKKRRRKGGGYWRDRG